MRKIELRNIPLLTILLVATLLLVAQFPAWGRALIYERPAILQGELWRLPGCNLVHYSTAHLCWNLLPLLVFGCWLEINSRTIFGILLLLAPLTNGALLLRPDIIYFAGASGFVVAVVTGLCLAKLTSSPHKGPWLLLLLLMTGKIGYELLTARAIFAPGHRPVLPLSHLLGLLSAVMVVILFRLFAGKTSRY